MARLLLRARRGPPLCPYCRDDVHAHERQPCPGCGAVYHPECRQELGRCGTIGCATQPKPRAQPPNVNDPDRPALHEVWPWFWGWWTLAWVGWVSVVGAWLWTFGHYAGGGGGRDAAELLRAHQTAEWVEGFGPALWLGTKLLFGLMVALWLVRTVLEGRRRRAWRAYRRRLGQDLPHQRG